MITKKSRSFAALLQFILQGADDLTGTQATGAGVYVSRGAVHHRFHTTHIGFPSSVRTSVGVGNTNTEANSLTAEITLCHIVCTSFFVCVIYATEI